jgi:glycosyltransferase involved in cell wall biosynthesis
MTDDAGVGASGPLRLVYASGSEIPSRRANSVHVMKMCEALGDLGHHVVLLAVPGEGEREGGADPDPYPYYGVARSFEIRYLAVRRWKILGPALLGRAIRRAVSSMTLGPDLVYSRHVYASHALARVGIPLVHEAHGPPRNRLEVLLERRLLRGPALSRFVLISNALREYYREAYPDISPERFVVAHDAAAPAPGTAATLDLFRSSSRLRAGYTGGLYRGRGIELILELARERPGIEFHLAGDGPLAEMVERSAARLPNLVAHGYLDQPGVASLQAACDILLAPYAAGARTAGGFDTTRWMSPLKLFEYMAAGKAIVCSDLPVLGEVLEDGATALLAPPGDLAAWTTALDELADADRRNALGEAARLRWQEAFTWDARARKVLGAAREGVEGGVVGTG